MQLITKAIEKRLRKNGEAQAERDGANVEAKPVVKFFTPDAQATWLITEVDPDDPDRLFGLCDLGLGFPELGYVSLHELQTIRGRFGLHVERDKCFTPTKTLLEYAAEARAKERIVA